MKNAVQEAKKAMTVEEYIQYELTAEYRHEYINGQLFEVPGEKDVNNETASEIVALLKQLKPKGFTVYNYDVKVAIPGGEKYYYSDVFATKEAKVDTNPLYQVRTGTDCGGAFAVNLPNRHH